MPWQGRWPWPQVLTPSLPTSQGGIFWFTLIDTYSTGFGLVIITLFMCLGISFCYGERGWGLSGAGCVRWVHPVPRGVHACVSSMCLQASTSSARTSGT